MKCPYCEKEIPGKSCPECGAFVPEQSLFCMDCGERFSGESTEAADQTPEEFDLEDRVLCPDGTCTGIIVEGKCSECGRSEAGIEEKEA